MRSADALVARAVELAPSHAPARLWRGLALAANGQFAAALFQVDAALAIDPLSLVALTGHGWVLHQMRRLDEAVHWHRTVLERDPTFAVAAFHCGRALAATGDVDGALRALEAARGMGNGWAEGYEGYLLGRRGRSRAARARLATLRTTAERGYVAPAASALVHLGLGEEADALALFERSLAACDPLLLVFLIRDPLLEACWRLPDFETLRARAGLPVA